MTTSAFATAEVLTFVAPHAVEIRSVPLGPPPPGHVLFQARLSAISAGTERLAWRGELPPDTVLDETLALGTGSATTFQYPFAYGYASVGTVVACGAGVPEQFQGQRVFAYCAHASASHVPWGDVVVLPEALADDAAVLLASMETAVNLVLDAAPLLGERVMVLGQGVVGLLTTALLSRFPLAALTAVEEHAARAQLARRLGAHQVLSPQAALRKEGQEGQEGRADLVIELSGRPETMDLALALAGQEARVVVGSWYGNRRAPIDLGGSFHRRRLRVISSQVSHIAPHLCSRWTRARRWEVALAALARMGDEGLVTSLLSHRVPFAAAAEAYALLDAPAAGSASAGNVLQIVLVHTTSPERNSA